MLAISILNLKEKEKLLKLDKEDFDLIHLDVMDNIFVPNKTREFKEISEFVKGIKHPLDIHLMVEDVIKYVDVYKNLNPKSITFHIETSKNPVLMIDYIKKNDIKVGLAINPNTDIKKIEPYLNIVDLVLIMSVEPGYGGQEFINITDKLKLLREIRKKYDYKFVIEIDGGINNETVSKVKSADIIVSGSYITSKKNYKVAISELKMNMK